MTDDLHTLAAAVVQSPHWRFGSPQSRKQEPRRTSSGVRWIRAETHGDWMPDLRDPATLGCLLALVREAWGDPEVRTTALMIPGRWRVVVHELAGYPRHQWFDAGSEPAALVAALLAAPKEVDNE